MPQKWPITNATQILAALLIMASMAVAAPKYQVLHNFGASGDGSGLWGGLALDSQGNVYGTAVTAGPNGDGIVFELTPGRSGKWNEIILHSFPSFYDDGAGPGGSLVLDAAGNVYGTAGGGGTHGDSGIAFELTHGSWDETVLYNFCAKSGCSDGGSPSAGIIADGAGNLYGAAWVVFELSPGSNGWTETTLYGFCRYDGDGCQPTGVVMDASGNIYGTTVHGGTDHSCDAGCGTAYQLYPVAGGHWKEHILHDFGNGDDGMALPNGVLTVDGAGNLYGVDGIGGSTGNGVVYRLSRDSRGHWRATILYRFAGGADGSYPVGLVLDKSGILYGVTAADGDPNCDCGVVFKMAPRGGNKGNKWKYTVLHTFIGSDGWTPEAALILDSKGNIYGTTVLGGTYGGGVAFKIIP